MRNLQLSLLTSLAAAALLSPSPSFGASNQKLSQQDQTFVDQAWNINTTEIRLGDAAEHKATTADVKAFAKRMVKDHTKLNGELSTLAQEHGAVLPNALGRHQQQLIDRLSKLTSSDFDRQYMTAMIEGHEKAVAAFEKESNDRAQTAVDKWAGQALPTLSEHLQLAEKTGKEVGATIPEHGTAVPAAHQEHPRAK